MNAGERLLVCKVQRAVLVSPGLYDVFRTDSSQFDAICDPSVSVSTKQTIVSSKPGYYSGRLIKMTHNFN